MRTRRYAVLLGVLCAVTMFVPAVIAGQAPAPEAIRAAADAAASSDIDPSSDIHASARYRRQLANVLTRRVLTRAFERAQ